MVFTVSLAVFAFSLTSFTLVFGESPPRPRPPRPPFLGHLMMPPCNESWYGDWKETEKCVWPTTIELDDLPEPCRSLPPKPDKLPDAAYDFLKSKHEEHFHVWKKEAGNRKLGKETCGHCSYKLKCRNLKEEPKYLHCPTMDQVFNYDKECQKDQKPCKMSQVDGGCPVPESIEGYHQLTLLKSLAMAGDHHDSIMVHNKVKMFFEFMLGGIPNPMGGMGGGPMMGPPPKPPPLLEMIKKGMGGKEKNEATKFLDALIAMMSGRADPMKGLLDDLPETSGELPETEEVKKLFTAVRDLLMPKKGSGSGSGEPPPKPPLPPPLNMKVSRTSPMVKPPAPARILLKATESLYAPKMHCIRNGDKDCLCCCNYHLPHIDKDGKEQCVDVGKGIDEFIRDFLRRLGMVLPPAPPPPEEPFQSRK